MTLNCSAEGNPPPETYWQYTSAANVMETTGGRQKDITITGATSSNAGSYVCVATNRVGTARRAVSLMMNGIYISGSVRVLVEVCTSNWLPNIFTLQKGKKANICGIRKFDF